ncbi:hypothetical protein RclHR1_02320015 [Rhizophagus clarus]|uniref:Uncharacterized protein n=1 Tax=Rhizophagus clarus TaxID=94130 RepID=A0A2Z6QW98_9GLOM|nr:hypothetical protein RclHR1_02320015 [Rhizophagus clarus]GES85886.1 hypothetical protein GLOIN_2v1548262 [Rhizophagus clarus]
MTTDFQEFQEFQNHYVPSHQLTPQQMTTNYPSYAYGSYPASYFPNFFVIPCAALQNNFNNLRMMPTPEPAFPVPNICRCDHQLYQLPPIYQTYSQQSSMSSATFHDTDEPGVLPYQSHQSYHTSAIPQTSIIGKQSTLRNDYPETNHTHQKNRKNKQNQFAPNMKKDPNVYELIFKDTRPIIPRSKKVKNIVQFKDYSPSGIRRSVERVYSQLENKVWGFFKCESLKLVSTNEPQSMSDINRISGFRKRLYVGLK